MTPESPIKPNTTPTGPDTDSSVLAAHHRLNLRLLHRIPYDPEYVTPQEILLLLDFCHEYGVDFTVGLEPRRLSNEIVCLFCLPSRQPNALPAVKRCRVRREILLQDTRGTLIPDGDIVWARQLVGRLKGAVARELQTTIQRVK